ncbi:unnamed protein product, partial [Heterosigma akashiwo]
MGASASITQTAPPKISSQQIDRFLRGLGGEFDRYNEPLARHGRTLARLLLSPNRADLKHFLQTQVKVCNDLDCQAMVDKLCPSEDQPFANVSFLEDPQGEALRPCIFPLLDPHDASKAAADLAAQLRTTLRVGGTRDPVVELVTDGDLPWLEAALPEARTLVVLLSPALLGSSRCQLTLALAARFGLPAVPVVLLRERETLPGGAAVAAAVPGGGKRDQPLLDTASAASYARRLRTHTLPLEARRLFDGYRLGASEVRAALLQLLVAIPVQYRLAAGAEGTVDAANAVARRLRLKARVQREGGVEVVERPAPRPALRGRALSEGAVVFGPTLRFRSCTDHDWPLPSDSRLVVPAEASSKAYWEAKDAEPPGAKGGGAAAGDSKLEGPAAPLIAPKLQRHATFPSTAPPPSPSPSLPSRMELFVPSTTQEEEALEFGGEDEPQGSPNRSYSPSEARAPHNVLSSLHRRGAPGPKRLGGRASPGAGEDCARHVWSGSASPLGGLDEAALARGLGLKALADAYAIEDEAERLMVDQAREVSLDLERRRLTAAELAAVLRRRSAAPRAAAP